MRLFAIDQHISGIMDLRQIFDSFGHTIDDVCMSGHAKVIGRIKESVPMLDGDNWCNVCHSSLWDKFYLTYKDKLKDYDAFVCFYPPIFARLYDLFDKPIIIQVPIRYEYGVDSDAMQWNEWNTFLQKDKVFLVANSAYDKRYTELFTQRSVTHIPNLCEYAEIEYKPCANHILYYSPFRDNALNNIFVRKNDLLSSGHSWKDLGMFKAIMHYPYNVSTMSLFEQYTANIPLLCPSKALLMDMYAKHIDVLDQMSWNKTYKKAPGSTLKIDFEHDPNRYDDLKSVEYWLQFADFYNEKWMPHIQYFDSIAELNCIANMFTIEQYKKVSDAMRETNKWRKQEIYSRWENILSKVAKS